jgi:mannose-6-phosphate isomerase-like protein (cupin superfamily)
MCGMSYPEPRYLGTTGETSAVFRPAVREQDRTPSSGTSAIRIAAGDDTGGRFGMYRWEMDGTPGGPDPHFHRTVWEFFYVLSGQVRMYDGQRWFDAAAGDFFFLPEGAIHAFRNESGAPAAMLILFSPGAPRTEYYETLSDRSRWNSLTAQERAEFYQRHDTYLV